MIGFAASPGPRICRCAARRARRRPAPPGCGRARPRTGPARLGPGRRRRWGPAPGHRPAPRRAARRARSRSPRPGGYAPPLGRRAAALPVGSLRGWFARWGCPSTRSSGRGDLGAALRPGVGDARGDVGVPGPADPAGPLRRGARPPELTFARYEVLVLLTFSRTGAAAQGDGSRLMVHPTSVTNAIDRLVAAGYVERRPNPQDGRGVLAGITPRGRDVVDGHPGAHRPRLRHGRPARGRAETLYELLRRVRLGAATSRRSERRSTPDSWTS